VAVSNVTSACSSHTYASPEDVREGARQIYASEGPWTALSHCFESLCALFGRFPRSNLGRIAQVRPELLRFVEEVFPEDVMLDVLASVRLSDRVKELT
jgi:hypothetical protein